ncbi:Short-chain dehydrogenase protein [Neofusicoccum parvum]|nr:Short-chain dehydrogenase protein [Neofusicoccum parvum]
MYVEQSSWAHFVNTQPPEAIAKRIRLDDELVNAGSPCSFTAYFLPKSSTPHALAIANHLVPTPQLSPDTKRLVYQSLVSKIKAHLLEGPRSATRRADGRWALKGGITWQPPAEPEEQEKTEPEDQELSSEDLSTTLRVLQRLVQTNTVQSTTPVSTAITTLQHRLHSAPPPPRKDEAAITTSTHRSRPPPHHQRLCYICRLTIHTPHPLYPCLCPPCGAFNLSNSALSLPPALSLPTHTALITGARLNLGYHTALRLLRCGARVIASTRYPRDAAARYAREPDRAAWQARLRIVGADFRCAADAFALVDVAKRVLAEWGAPLAVLVNNAAQTLTDAVDEEERAVAREERLRLEGGSALLADCAYRARVRGGAERLLDGGAERLLDGGAERLVDGGGERGVVGTGAGAGAGAELATYTKSSWVQSLSEIPYEDVVAAHAVNAFVPLILCRELLPLMGGPAAAAADATKPRGYIVNVSSREGIFEDRPAHSSKRGHHVHTNMSKAALNMLTETEAAAAWRSRRVAMNTVDPGYMSAAPEYEDAYGGYFMSPMRPSGQDIVQWQSPH